jgi:hypothetical protein
VSNENFRRELNGLFDDLSGTPSPALRDRVRSAVANPPEERPQGFWIAGVATAAIAVIIVGTLFVANRGGRLPNLVPGGITHSSPSPSANASPEPTPIPSPSASPAITFVCTSSSTSPSGSHPAVAFIDALRTGAHSGYDRVTIEFQNGAPGSVQLTTQTGTRFTMSPSGQSVQLAGQNGILVTIRGADLHTAYSGPIDILTHYTGKTALVEVRRAQDFEGVVQLALGVNGSACYRVTLLTNPARIVIDVPASS